MNARVTLVVLATLAHTAHAEPVPAPTASRIVHAPTAWMQPQGQLYVQLGASHRPTPAGSATFGLGDVAELELELADRFIACPGCGETRDEHNLFLGTAAFRTGIATDPAARPWRTGVVLGFRRSFAGRALTAGGRDARLEAAQLHLVAGLRIAGFELHAGAELHDARHGDAPLRAPGEPWTSSVRPLAGIAWIPPPYPRTSLLLDVAYLPEVKDAGPRLRWTIGWGVRYQALRWGAIDLLVRQREDQALGDAAVMVRLTGALALGKPLGTELR